MTFFYAIRHIPSRGFLPYTKEGFSRVQPTTTAVPRLFHTQRAAVLTMNAYVRGVWAKVYSDERVDMGAKPVKGTARNPDDYEVIHMSLVEVKDSR